MTLYFRHGADATGRPLYKDEKGKPYTLTPRPCSRCGGAGGSDKWAHTGWTCFDCGGSGKHIHGPEKSKLYTAEQLVKLNATADKKAAKKAAAAAEKAAIAKAEAEARRADFEEVHKHLIARAEAFASRSEFVADVLYKGLEKCEWSDKQCNALLTAIERIEANDKRKAGAVYLGKIGERLKGIKATVMNRVSGEGLYGLWAITTLRTPEGNTIVIKSGRFYAEKGDEVTITGTVKDHSLYGDEKQTQLERVKIEEAKETA